MSRLTNKHNRHKSAMTIWSKTNQNKIYTNIPQSLYASKLEVRVYCILMVKTCQFKTANIKTTAEL